MMHRLTIGTIIQNFKWFGLMQNAEVIVATGKSNDEINNL